MGQHTLNRPRGTLIVCAPNGMTEADTNQCVHCGAHWRHRPGSGKVRGFCGRCNGPICSAKCAACVPVEQFLENMEAGRAPDFVPTKTSVIWAP